MQTYTREKKKEVPQKQERANITSKQLQKVNIILQEILRFLEEHKYVSSNQIVILSFLKVNFESNS